MKKNTKTLVFNGEVYNFWDIRQRLEEEGYSFRSTTDTEVLLAAYDKWGKECFELLNGPLAAAFYDESNGELILARDRVGEKPLYYYIDEDATVYFSSTIKQIMSAKQKTWELNEDRIVSDLIFNFWSDKTQTHISGIYAVPAGSLLIINQTTGEVITRPYWSLPSSEVLREEREVIQIVDELLCDATTIRARLDAPIGAILSGGIDSTLLVSLAKSKISYPLRCFTLSRGDYIDEDLYYAKKYCEDVSLPHTEVKLKDEDLGVDALIAVTREMEEPSLDQVYLYISRNYETAKSSGLKSVLNGQGADELFLGYLDYYSFLRDEKNYKTKKAFETYWLNQSPLKDFLDIPTMKRVISENIQRNYAPYQSTDALNSVLRFGIKTHLPALLSQEDKQSMRWSIECRTVFTDYRLVEFMSSVPSDLKKLDDKEKYILRKVAGRYLPEYITKRKKLGFPDLPDNRSRLVDSLILNGLLRDSPILKRILNQELLKYQNELPLSMKWKLCSIAILEKSILKRNSS
jgi:asparagine synthase (glutamine-hydrolysing)